MLLDHIQSPSDVRALPIEQLPSLAEELRQDILYTISAVGGHLSSNLGSIELTVALHYAFNTPEDRIVWDVGHQTYAHKILTGRRSQLATIRQKGGLSGFPVRKESVYDTFGTAHASTSISAALGMAVAAAQQNSTRRVVAVIGDGALSGGMAFEALNNAGIQSNADLLVILNDNEMSISPAVGAMTNSLNRILASRFYNRLQSGGRKMLSKLPSMQKFARRAHEHLKGMILPGTLFEEFNFNYVGPIDGHDVLALTKTLSTMRETPGMQFLHVVTVKGKGYDHAELDPVRYHGVGKFEPQKGLAPMKVEKSTPSSTLSYTEVFGRWLMYAAQKDSAIVGITPAMEEGSGLVEFANAFPERYFDVGIAEQHALTFAAGLACEGLKPIVAIYSTFLQRAYDQLIHDIAIQELPVIFAIDRGGIVGADGATHHGAFDLSYLRCIPNLTVMAPADENELWKMLNTALDLSSPVAVRYPRGQSGSNELLSTDATLALGKGVLRRQGEKIAILSFGTLLSTALIVGENLNASVADMRFIKPLDVDLICKLAHTHDFLVSLEENVIAGGAGAAVNEVLQQHHILKPLHLAGLPDQFVEHGNPKDLLTDCGLDAKGLQKQIEHAFRKQREK